MTSRDYDDVPGTYVLDSRSYRKGYHLNMFCMSLNKVESVSYTHLTLPTR